ncbi:MAG: D-alanyl-D-alanine carboxypeptidase/D-alanyl-D-alanine-endopeptidase [Gammaproteobacteria bacterium]|nr:D-alanyl-D-alanine carboxypeptidase/D-alanyl-D-alanine-endopeptidase [Gammaproteobacteria bacterium]MDH5499943.1 D-alanyl-D-alanine carboxypeptidase/D-alanyl-D-alanine-endopeptidase [Gammaproteobacteria bacterium]
MRLASLVLLVVGLLFQDLSIASSELPAAVRSVLNVRKLPDDSLSIYVESLETGESPLSWHDEQPRNPASVAKLLTTLVALDTLGPAYRWRTEVYAQGEVTNDKLQGDLLLKGYGDPFLVTERMWQMLRRIRQSGIRDIEGDLLLDDSYFSVPETDPAAFDREPLRAYNVAPNALLTNFKVVRYHFEPDPLTKAVSIRLDPQLENLQVINRLSQVNGRCYGYQRGITITPNEKFDRFVLSGEFPNGCRSYAMDRTVLEHNAYTYGLFKAIWQETGGNISGSWKNQVVAEDAEPMLSFESEPLADVITMVNKHSNNVMARQLLYTLSAEKLGAPGTEEGGREVIRKWLDERDLASAGLMLDNGAGLSREARISARQMAAILKYAYASPYMPEYLSSLSLSGLDGTLSRRFRNSPLTGKAHVKTGSLDHVSAIAGYVQGSSGERFVVVALQNHTDIHRGPGEEVQEALLEWLYEQ